jgi:hypothetical protein
MVAAAFAVGTSFGVPEMELKLRGSERTRAIS